MKEFGIKTAFQKILNEEKVNMSSTDFKSHIFYLNKEHNGKPIIHEIIRNLGPNLKLHVSYDEFKEKFKDNKFYEL